MGELKAVLFANLPLISGLLFVCFVGGGFLWGFLFVCLVLEALSLRFPRSNELSPFREELTYDWHNKGLLFLADPCRGIKTLLYHLKCNFLLFTHLWALEETCGAAAPPAGFPYIIFAALLSSGFWLLYQRMRLAHFGNLSPHTSQMLEYLW